MMPSKIDVVAPNYEAAMDGGPVSAIRIMFNKKR